MSRLSSLGYVVFAVSDLERWEAFAVDILGMQAGQRDTDRLSLRLDQHEHRIVLERGAADDLAAAGWELDSDADLDAFVESVRTAGVEVREADASLTAQRKVRRLFLCDDPNGFRHEFYAGPSIAPMTRPFRSKLVKGGFQCGPLGVGHILPVARDFEQSMHFYTQVLGLKISDHIREERAPGMVAHAVFFHSACGRHHSLATGQFPSAKILNHFMVEVTDIDDVGMAYDRCLKAGIPVAATLGRHPNDQMFSFYVQTPSGFNVEFGHGGVVIDDANWTVTTYSQMSDWGHARSAHA